MGDPLVEPEVGAPVVERLVPATEAFFHAFDRTIGWWSRWPPWARCSCSMGGPTLFSGPVAYAPGESTTNRIQPFFALPILTLRRLRFGDVVGYTFGVARVCFGVSALAPWWIPAWLEGAMPRMRHRIGVRRASEPGREWRSEWESG